MRLATSSLLLNLFIHYKYSKLSGNCQVSRLNITISHLRKRTRCLAKVEDSDITNCFFI